MIDKDFKLENYDLQYLLDIDYTRAYPNGGCDCNDDYCRCMIIDESDVTINTSLLTTKKMLNLFITDNTIYNRELKINETLEGTDINSYCIGRIISINKLHNKENYTIDIDWGYYGQEVNYVKLNGEIANKVQEEIVFLLQMDNIKEKIEYLLCLEYNYLLDGLYGKKWRVIEVDKTEIDAPNKQHYKNINQLDFYNDFNYTDIRCVIRELSSKVGKKYKLVDGYHRLKNTKKKTVKCLLAY